MENLMKALEELDNSAVEWEKLKKNGYQVSYDDLYGNTLIELITELRTQLKKYSLEECKGKLKDFLDRYGWLDDILDYADKSLGYYRQLAALRELDGKSKELAVSFLGRAFDNYVVRANPEFINTWKQFGMKDESEMLQVIRTISFLTEFYVSHSYAKSAVKKDFYGESGLSEGVCDAYAELVDRNYMEIKINLIYINLKEKDKE